MSKFSEQVKTQERTYEQKRAHREALGKFFFDLAKLVFTAIVLSQTLMLQSDVSNGATWVMIIIGIVVTWWLAVIGDKFHK